MRLCLFLLFVAGAVSVQARGGSGGGGGGGGGGGAGGGMLAAPAPATRARSYDVLTDKNHYQVHMSTDLQFFQNFWNHSSRSWDQLKVNAQLILIDVNGQRAIPRLESKEFLVRKGGSVMDQ